MIKPAMFSLPLLPYSPEKDTALWECIQGDEGLFLQGESIWRDWSTCLYGVNVPSQSVSASVVGIWLDGSVELAVDMAWDSLPSEGYFMHTLAMALCMAAVRKLVPRFEEKITENRGRACAPFPLLSEEQSGVLQRLGLLSGEGADRLVCMRRYAIVTWTPYRGGCTVCALRQTCQQLI